MRRLPSFLLLLSVLAGAGAGELPLIVEVQGQILIDLHDAGDAHRRVSREVLDDFLRLRRQRIDAVGSEVSRGGRIPFAVRHPVVHAQEGPIGASASDVPSELPVDDDDAVVIAADEDFHSFKR